MGTTQSRYRSAPLRQNRRAATAQQAQSEESVEKGNSAPMRLCYCGKGGDCVGIRRSQTGGSIVKYHTRTIIASRISATDRK